MIYKHQTKLILIVFSIILGLGVLITLVASPLLAKVSGTQNKIRENQAKLQAIALEIANYKSLSTQFTQVTSQKQSFTAAFPARENSLALVSGIEAAAERAGLTIKKLTITDHQDKKEQNPSQTEKTPPVLIAGIVRLEEIPYLLQLSGDYRDLTDFFFYLEHLSYVTVPDKLTIAADKNQGDNTNILRNTGTGSAKLEGLMYIFKP